MYSITFNINELPTLQADKFVHNKARSGYRKKWHTWMQTAMWINGTAPPPVPLKRCKILGIRYCVGVPPDRINVWYSFKTLVDACNELHYDKKGRRYGLLGIIEDDSPSVVIEEDYYSERVKHKYEQRVTLTITEVI